MRMREPWCGLVTGLPVFRDEAEYRRTGGDGARVVVAHGGGPVRIATWVPASIWFVAHGRASISTGELTVVLEPGRAWVAEHGARLTLAADTSQTALCALLVPEAVVAACAAQVFGRGPRGPLVVPELVHDAPTLTGPLLRHARLEPVADGQRDGAAIVASLDAIVRALLQRQAAWAPELARCPGRTERHRRQLFVRLMRTRLALEADGGIGCPLVRLARLANLSPTHYLRVYRRVFGMTPHEHATHMRLSEAHRRLVSTDEPVADIGYALGFSNRCAFARAFRAYHGAAPSTLRRRARGEARPFAPSRAPYEAHAPAPLAP